MDFSVSLIHSHILANTQKYKYLYERPVTSSTVRSASRSTVFCTNTDPNLHFGAVSVEFVSVPRGAPLCWDAGCEGWVGTHSPGPGGKSAA